MLSGDSDGHGVRALLEIIEVDGERVPGFYVVGGSFPQGTQERNPCNCTMDTIQLFDRAVTSREVAQQYRLMDR